MKKLLLITLILTSLFSFWGCNKKTNYTQKELINMITNNEPANFVIDVRTHTEYNEKHIPRAINIPLDKIEERISSSEYGISKDDIIIVYCRSGNRSSQAKELLKKLGYKNVYDFGAMSNYF